MHRYYKLPSGAFVQERHEYLKNREDEDRSLIRSEMRERELCWLNLIPNVGFKSKPMFSTQQMRNLRKMRLPRSVHVIDTYITKKWRPTNHALQNMQYRWRHVLETSVSLQTRKFWYAIRSSLRYVHPQNLTSQSTKNVKTNKNYQKVLKSENADCLSREKLEKQ